jgi:hypothetical protein
MDIVRLIAGLICLMFTIFLGILSSIKPKHRDKIDDIPRYMKRGFREKFYGAHENDYSKIDDAQFHYALDKMNKEYKGSKERKKKLPEIKENTFKKKDNKHNWYKYKSWKDLINNSNDWSYYLNDRKYARTEFLFNWNKVFDKILPYVKNEKNEVIGVIRVENDNKTLYILDMEVSPNVKRTESYAAGVNYDLVEKYDNIPGYFLFHTHPRGINCDPLPSDADLFTCLLDCYSEKFIGHVVIGEYGAVVYFLRHNRWEQLIPGGMLKYMTYCYDVINAWNSFNNSAAPHKQSERLKFLETWGFDMIIIPSPKYTSDSYDKFFLSSVLHDRFIKTKYELLDRIKNFIKKLEIDEENKKLNNK